MAGADGAAAGCERPYVIDVVVVVTVRDDGCAADGRTFGVEMTRASGCGL
jgi:hypothetical protein